MDRVPTFASLGFHVCQRRAHELLVEVVEHPLAALGASAAATLVDRTVAHDREDPAARAAARLAVAAGMAPDRQEGLLDDFLAYAMPAAESIGKGVRRAAVAPIDQLVGAYIAAGG